ncbi:esterase-like activity of phytase family protein [Cellulomonas sp.]|uniref:esterase-like activity of phytase family protein n=1 Tax=Cellulomonas sp. TaxID=40001 RepID=UPI002811795C|nr:esterase-like activity of phytase family protein [Cellulomonas sp.]
MRRSVVPPLALAAALALGAGLLPTAASAAVPSAADPAVGAGASAGAATLDGGRGHDRGRATVTVPTLVARATLSADFLADGPPSGALASAANGRQGPFAGQVIPGFSGAVDAGDGTFWALPDNGFGTKANSADFLLRIYRVTPDWQTADGGSGELRVGEHLSLRDPDRHVDFPITHGDTPDRLLTGADFDVESIVRARDGSFWIGEEFGPFLLHVDATGRLLAPPVPLPGATSPQNPYLAPGEQPTVRASGGFEALAGLRDGRYLYPVLENAYTADPDQRRRVVHEFDTRRNAWTGRTWDYRADREGDLVGDAFWVGRHEMLLVERDNFDGAASVVKRVYRVDLRREDRQGFLEKELVLDALDIANPHGIGAGDGYGTGDPFSLPVQSFETVVQLRDGRLLIGNDNNYPGNAARVPGTPDDTEMALVELRRERVRPGEVDVIAHRGASGYRPEHTLAAYALAIRQCADWIEPDVVATKDGVLVARHENEIGGTTDVATRPEFADRRTTKSIDGQQVTGWFTEDFTLAELRTLRAKERIPALRPGSAAFDGLYEVPTLAEVLDLARHSVTCDGEQVGVYPETKHPSYFDSVGLSLEEPLVAELRAAGLDHKKAPVIVQSFETGNLRELDRMTKVRLAQLVSCSGAPWDLVAAGDPRTYADLVTRQGLREIARYADGLGACKDVVIPREADGSLGAPTTVVRDAHRAGLEVHAWTFRAENQFLPADLRSSADPAAHGDLPAEIRAFVDAGVDAVFSDHPDVAVATVG